MQRVGFVVGPGFPLMSLAALAAFEFANSSVERPFYDVRVLSEAGGRVPSSLGLAIETKRLGSSMFDTVIITGTMDVAPASRGVLAFVRKAAKGPRPGRRRARCRGVAAATRLHGCWTFQPRRSAGARGAERTRRGVRGSGRSAALPEREVGCIWPGRPLPGAGGVLEDREQRTSV